jgi:hypothetical protein
MSHFHIKWIDCGREPQCDGFPRGRMIGPNSRARSEQEVEGWIASRPVVGPEPGVAKRGRGRPRKADSTASATT